MAKVVIAGCADCPYFAKVELLGDKLAKNLPDFKLHKIVVNSNEWPSWLQNVCNERGWSHEKSPIVWRELIDRGGKGLLIGGANDFQEYANGYYGIKSDFTSSDMTKIASENQKTKKEIDEEEAAFKSLSNPLHVCISSAASHIAYNMIKAIGAGDCLGPDTEISLRLLDSPENAEILDGVSMEAFDLACPLLRKITTLNETRTAFKDASVIILLDELVKEESESDEDYLKRNHKLYVEYAEVINSVAKKDVKILVAGNGPVNFNVYMMQQHMPDIPKENVVGVSRMLENHAKAILSERLNVNSAGVVDITVWGNAGGTTIIDVSKGRVHNYDGAVWGPPSFSVSAPEMVHDAKWLSGEFVTAVSERSSLLKVSLGHRAALSLAAAVATLLQDWWNGANPEQMFSLAVRSDGSYGIPEGMVCSVPVRFNAGSWSLVKDIELTDENNEKLQEIVKELQKEMHVVYPPPSPPTPAPETAPEPETAQAPESAPAESEGTENAETGGESDNKDAGDKSEPEAEQKEQQEEEEEEDPDKLGKIAEDREGEEKAAGV